MRLPLLITLITVALFAEERTPVTIAVNRLATSGMDAGEGFALTNALRTELGKTEKFQVMERSRMDEILKEQGFQKSGACDDASCAIEIGQLLAVKYMVLGSVGRVGKTYSLNIRLVDVGSGKIDREVAENHKGAKDKLLTEVAPLAARKLAGTYRKRRSPAPFIIGSVALATAGLVVAVVGGPEPHPEPGDPSEQQKTDVRFTW
jgi:TolB-like protein